MKTERFIVYLNNVYTGVPENRISLCIGLPTHVTATGGNTFAITVLVVECESYVSVGIYASIS